METHDTERMEKIVSLCKRRGFIYQGSEIYGGLAGTWDYAEYGLELKNAIKRLWWQRFKQDRDDMYGIDAAILMNPKTWEASGHTETFADPLVECKKCHARYREDDFPSYPENSTRGGNPQIEITERFDSTKAGQYSCPKCKTKGQWTEPRQFNMMFATHAGATQDEDSIVYLRPETAQGIFVNFKNVVDSFHPRLPFGIAQIGKAFRNEIAPRDFLFRAREFEQMEVEYFVREDDWERAFDEWRGVMQAFIADDLGLDTSRVHELDVPHEELAHYSKRTIDFEFDYPFGRKELFGLAYRTAYDFSRHLDMSGQKLEYLDPLTSERFIPHVIEPSLGVDRAVLAVLVCAYREDELGGEMRSYLALPAQLAPIKVAVFPLLRNKPQLVDKAREVYGMLKQGVSSVMWDDNGNIGKRYRRQDEIGTPMCVTIDFETLDDDTVTVRDRDTGKQERVAIGELAAYLSPSH